MAAGPERSAPWSGATRPAFFRARYLYLCTALETIYLFTSTLAPTSWVQVPLGLATLLVVPGYAVGALVLGTRTQLPYLLLFALAVGWSVGINVGVGLLLLLAHAGLPAVVLGAVAFLLSGVATGVWTVRGWSAGPSHTTQTIGRLLRLSGYRPAQRTAAYALFASIVGVLLVTVYLAGVVVNPTPNLIFSITGYGGTTANLPPFGTVNATLVIWAIIVNGASGQNFTLLVRSTLAGTNPTSYQIIPWTLPLACGNGTEASDSVALAARENATVNVEFQYAQTGDYELDFLLEATGGAVVRSATWAISIT